MLAKRFSQRFDLLDSSFAQIILCLACCIGKPANRYTQVPLDILRQSFAFNARRGKHFTQGCKLGGLLIRVPGDAFPKPRDLAHRAADVAACRADVIRERAALVARFAQRVAHGLNAVFDLAQPGFGAAQCFGQLLASMVAACLNNFEQAHCGIGKIVDLKIGTPKRMTHVDDPLAQRLHRSIQRCCGFAAL
jgi:hypothetical protein